MLATIRADFYRLFRTKGFWITQLVMILFIVVTIASQSVGTVGVGTPDSMNAMETSFDIKWTGMISVSAVTSMMSFFLYAMLPMLVMIIGHDFTKQTYKNILTVGVSRTKYVLSQYISFALMVLLQVVYIYVASFVTGSVLYGVGAGFDFEQVKDWLFAGLVQFLMIMAIMTLSCLITYVTKNNIFSVITAILFPIITSVLVLIFKDVKWIGMFDFQSFLSASDYLVSGAKEVTQSIIAAIGTIIVLLSITLWKFNRIEL